MTSRERVIRTLRFDGPDRIPVDLWSLPAAWERHGEGLRQLLERYPTDFGGSGYEDPFYDPRAYQVGEYDDVWGCHWVQLRPGMIGEVKRAPLEDYAALESYRPPVHLLDRGFDRVGETLARDHTRFVNGWGGNPFERMQFLRGPENLYMDIASPSEEFAALRDMVFGFFEALVDRWLKTEVDGITFLDDWGSQRGLLIRPEAWRGLFRPSYERLIGRAKAAGRFVFFHSDGHIFDIYGDLIEMGVDAINSQLWCMDIDAIAARYAGKVTFWGEVSRQDTLPRGTPDDVRAAARRMRELLFVSGGGLIGEGEVGGDVPLANVEALLTAWNEP